MGKQQTEFTVYPTNHGAQYTMAYTCNLCDRPVVGYSNDPHGLFNGTCPNGHQTGVRAS